MIPLTLEAVAVLVGGRLHDVDDPTAVVSAPASIDSRDIEPGGLFVALAGEHTDGHRFAAAAVKAGAVAALATRPVGVPAVVVDDVLDALADLARHVLAQARDAVVIGLTGSSGKTSTKDLVAQVLPELGRTTATPLSFNGELGLPLAVLRADSDTRYLVLEMGARGVGHITHLTGITPPKVGLVINVGTAHVGEFGSREAIAQAKGELVEALPTDGLAVLNADDPLVLEMATRTKARVMTFGVSEAADVRAENVELDPTGRPSFTLVADGGSAPVTLNLHGEHHVSNALATAAVAIGLGADVGKTAAALTRAVQVTPGRMQVTERSDGVTVINDAFNANPDSMRAALRALAAMADGRRTVTVMGEMRELGDDSESGHAAVGRLIAESGTSVLVAVGTDEADVMAGAAVEGNPALDVRRVPDRDAALEILRAELRPGDLVLIKGSHSVGLEETAARLLEPDTVA